MKLTRRILILITILLVAGLNALGQTDKPVPACTEKAFAALKSLPKVEYDCPEGLIESDDKILKLPARTAALRAVIKTLAEFANADWWQADVDELNACSIHGSAGSLTDEERQKWKDGDYGFEILGDGEFRLALLADPCYQPGYNGANAFLLYRRHGLVFVSQLLNGYYSRIENSVGLDFARANGELLIEVSTANSMPPSYWYHYFVIDPKTNQAVPKKLFKEGNKLTDDIWSAMLMSEPADLGLPKNAGELKVLDRHHLARTFSAYHEDEQGKIDANGRKLRRTVYRWNGRFYAPR
ncbi:MAG: hypothetical protein QOK48_551 [Blastocatellia bacterium]|nr:hypothetical protein [Blastocatellia bacterium]